MADWYKIYLQKLWLNQVCSLGHKVPILRLHDVEHAKKPEKSVIYCFRYYPSVVIFSNIEEGSVHCDLE